MTSAAGLVLIGVFTWLAITIGQLILGDQSDPGDLEPQLYAQLVQQLSCDISADLKRDEASLMRAFDAFVSAPEAEKVDRIRDYVAEVRRVAALNVATFDQRVLQLRILDPPPQFRGDQETFRASLDTIGGTYGGVLQLLPQEPEKVPPEELAVVLADAKLQERLRDLEEIFRSGLKGLEQERYSKEFLDLITCGIPPTETN